MPSAAHAPFIKHAPQHHPSLSAVLHHGIIQGSAATCLQVLSTILICFEERKEACLLLLELLPCALHILINAGSTPAGTQPPLP